MKLRFLDIIYLAVAAIWSIGLCFHVVKLTLGPEFYEQLRQGSAMFADFAKFYSLGKMIWLHETAQLYNLQAQIDSFNQVIGAIQPVHIVFSEYPPHFMLLFAALPLLSLPLSFLLWNFGSLSLSCFALFCVARVNRTLSFTAILAVITALVASVPSFRTMALGQSSWLYLCIVCLWCWAVFKKKDIGEGIALALSTIKFQYTPFLLIPALASRRRKTIVVFLAAELLMFFVSGLVLGWPVVLDYGRALLAAEDVTSLTGRSPEMVNLRGLLSHVLYPMPAFYVSIVAMLAVVAGTYVLLRKSDCGQKWVCSFTVLAALCFSPHTFIYDWVLLALPAVLILDSTSIRALLPVSGDKQKLLGVSIWLYPLVSWFVFLLLIPVTLKMLLLFVIGLLIFLQLTIYLNDVYLGNSND